MKPTFSRMRWLVSDGCLAALVVAASVAIVVPHLFTYTATIDATAGMLPSLFGPSVMVAVGRGFVMPEAAQVPALDRFLRQETDSLSPGDLPDEMPLGILRGWDRCHRYLLTFVGLVWRLFGISWVTYKIPMAILYCLTAPVVYGLFRLGMGRLLSMVGALLFLSSPLLLEETLHLRDFSKAPFILAVLLILGHLLRRPMGFRQLLGMAALLGFAMGLGWGFRQDLVIVIPLALGVLVFGARGHSRFLVRHRAASCGLLLCCFLLPALPILLTVGSEGGASATHDMAMGFATDCVENLELGPASYEIFYAFDDNFIHAAQSDYNRRVNRDPEPVVYRQPRASKAAVDHLIEIATVFPADLATRGLAAVRYVLKNPCMRLGPAKGLGLNVDNKVIAVAHGIHAPLAQHFDGFGLFYAAGFLLLAVMADLRLGWILFLLLLYICGYTSIQFQLRHAFHLGFLPLWFLGFWLDRLWFAGNRLRDAEMRRSVRVVLFSPRRWWCPQTRRAMASCGVAAAMIAGPFYALRAYQDRAVGRLEEAYRQAELIPLAVEQIVQDDWILFRPERCPGERLPETPGDGLPSWTVHTQYLAVDFAPDLSEHLMDIAYDQSEMFIPFDKIVSIRTDAGIHGGVTRFFFPVYEFYLPISDVPGQSRFLGVRVPSEQAGDIQAVYCVRNPDDFPLLLNLTLPPDAGLFRRHVTMWGGGTRVEEPIERRKAVQMAKGHACLAAGDFEGAVRAYRTAIAVDPFNSPIAHDALDSAYTSREDYFGRVTEWRAMVSTYPENARAYYHLGRALRATEDRQGAVEALQRAAALDPRDVAIAAHLGQALVEVGRWTEAVSALRHALDMAPFLDDLRPDFARALCGVGAFDEAREQVDRCRAARIDVPIEVLETLYRSTSR